RSRRRSPMQRSFGPMPASGACTSVGIHRPAAAAPVTLNSPACQVMTDFSQARPLTIAAGATLAEAQEAMQTQRVHLLLVVDERGRLAGLITSTDIEGEKPVRIVQERGIRRGEILITDIMTPLTRLEVLDIDDVIHARVGQLVTTLRAVGRQHALIVDFHNGAMKVRGLFSVSQVAHLLGTTLETVEVARSFAQVEEMLAH
ncbi:MAG TPA: CBS domain-containing protein, partial [Burkholderiales bacterium]